MPNNTIKHGKGLRQGDPLSLLFVIDIDPIQQILDVATRCEILDKIKGCGTYFWASLYADDAAVFFKPLR